MNNILSSLASNAPVIEAESQNGNLRLIALQAQGFDTLNQRPEFKQAGVYVCVGVEFSVRPEPTIAMMKAGEKFADRCDR